MGIICTYKQLLQDILSYQDNRPKRSSMKVFVVLIIALMLTLYVADVAGTSRKKHQCKRSFDCGAAFGDYCVVNEDGLRVCLRGEAANKHPCAAGSCKSRNKYALCRCW